METVCSLEETVCSLEETVSGGHVCRQDGTKNSRTWKDREQWKEKRSRFGESMEGKNGIQLCLQDSIRATERSVPLPECEVIKSWGETQCGWRPGDRSSFVLRLKSEEGLSKQRQRF